MIRMCRAIVGLGFVALLTLVGLAKEPDPKDAARGTPEAMGVPSAAIVAWIDAVDREVPGVMAFRLMRHNRLIAESYRQPFVSHWQYDFGLGKVSRLVTGSALAALVQDGDLSQQELDRLLTLDAGSPEGSREWSLAVEKASGKTLDQYLRVRVLNQLGGALPFWTATADPKGTMNGGWGLRMMLPDVSKIGRVLLDEGKWGAKQLLSESAVKALAKANPLGAGFGARSDGGQLLSVRPDLDAVLVVFTVADHRGRVCELADEILFKAMSSTSLPDDPAAAARLKARCAQQTIFPKASVSGPRETATYSLSSNSLGWTAIRLQRGVTNQQMVVVNGPCGIRRFAAAVGGWEKGQFRFSDSSFERFGDLTGDLRLTATATWTDDKTFDCRFFVCEAPADFELTLSFDGDRLAAELKSMRECGSSTERMTGARQSAELEYRRPQSDGEQHALLEIFPGGENGGRDSEGDVIRLKDGRLMVVWSQFDCDEDNGPADICARTSADDGKTWSPRRIVVKRPGPGENVMSCTLVRLNDGRIALAYLHQPNVKGVEESQLNIVFSADEGETWSAPISVIPESMRGFWIIINGGGLYQMKNGRLILPSAKGFDTLMVWTSDDCGKTWRHSDPVTAKDSRGYPVLLQEPGVIELKDGRLLMYARCDQGCQYFCTSSDGGATWTTPEPSSMISPRSPARMLRLSNGDILAAWNNHDGHPECRLLFPYHTGYRKPFTLGISRDEGKTWIPLRDFETEGWTCYASLMESNGKVYVIYSGDDLTSLRLSAWTLEELYKGRVISVKPGESIPAAQREARKRTRGEKVRIRLERGVHRLTEPLELLAEDSNIDWEGDGSVISGCQEVRNWTVEEDGTWAAEIPGVKESRSGFRTFFVNGESRPLARWPKQGVVYTEGEDKAPDTPAYGTEHWSFRIKPGQLDPKWTGLSEAELVMCHFWTDSHLKVRSIDPVSNVVWLVHPALKSLSDSWGTRDARWYVTNVRELMTEPGEWCLERKTGKLRYRPRPGETPDGVRCEIPYLRNLLTVRGEPQTLSRRVHDVTFRGITFTGCRYELPEGDVNNRQAAEQTDPAVKVFGADRIRFEHCAFSDLEAYGVGFLTGAHECVLEHCRLERLGAGGVKITSSGSFTYAKPVDEEGVRSKPMANPLLQARGNVVRDCEIRDYGRSFHAAVGVLMQHGERNVVTHNEICDGYYTGVSCGWVWGYGPNESRDNEISYNHIHHIGKGLLSDMGAIYTLGVQPGTVVRNNHIHDVDAHTYGGGGIYSDEGSTHILIENNLVHDTKDAAYEMHYGREVTVRNNIFAFGRTKQFVRTRRANHISLFVKNNIFLWETGKLFAGELHDVEPYQAPYQPADKGGSVTVTNTVFFDNNVYYSPKLPIEKVRFGADRKTDWTCSWDEWREAGQDVHSLYADPGFVDAAARDFRLKSDSPAFALGFVPFDLNEIGPRN